MKWCAALLPLLTAGCTPKQTSVPESPQRPPQPVLATTEAAVARQDFLAFVQQSADGTKRAAVRWLGEDREDVLAEGVEGELHIQPLPNEWPWWDEAKLQRDGAARKAPQPTMLYIDAYTGIQATPGSELGLDDGHSVLLDLAGDRALVARRIENISLDPPAAKLLLYRGAEEQDLGFVYLRAPSNSYHVDCFVLSPARDRLAWSGPEGSFFVDLTTGQVDKRAYGYRSRRSRRRRPREYILRWLPDGSGFIEHQWIGGGRYWYLFAAASGSQVGRGEGRVHEVSPDSRYWAIVNEAAVAGPYVRTETTPRFIRAVPGHQPAPSGRVVTQQWVIEGDSVRFFIGQPISHDQRACFRITPEGYQVVKVVRARSGGAAVLSAEDGGRLGMVVEEPRDGAGDAAMVLKTVIYDFDGHERSHIPTGGQSVRAAMPEHSLLAQADQDGGGWRVVLMDVVAATVSEVLTCQARQLRVSRAGDQHFIAVAEGDTQHGRADLYVGGIDGKPWRLVAEDVCESVVLPAEQSLVYR